MALGNNVRTFRRARGESITDLAQAVGIDKSLLSKLERGERGCSDEKKLALARHFGVSVTRLFFIENGDKKAPELEQVPA